MVYKNILITGGAGFVGSNFAIKLAHNYPNANIIALDNLKRRGSELNIPRLVEAGVGFVHGDIRNKEDLDLGKKIDLIIECSAEPSVMAGLDSSPEYLINTNLIGTINCLELARRDTSDFIFLSTSRVYPIEYINQLNFKEEEGRFTLEEKQAIVGASDKGIRENFPLDKPRSLYGATKLASELLLQEYINSYKIRGVINRCGVITGPWQMGKIDQGVIVLWMARHMFKKPLSYIGYGGTGKQVRDFIHVDDIFDLINIQIQDLNKFNGEIYNVGGGVENSISLLELTKYCEQITGKKIEISSVKEDRPNDVRTYISDYSKIKEATGWRPKKGIEETLREIKNWIEENKDNLSNILA
jgi:CDP-paratose 2-epimerase